MDEKRYLISDAAKAVQAEPHVLRYWEEELELPIQRTELGHRYYTEEDIQTFQNIKELKERGFQLKAIKVLLPELKKRKGDPSDDLAELEQKIVSQGKEQPETNITLLPLNPDLDKFQQFEEIMTSLFRQTLKENNEELENRISDSVLQGMDMRIQMREEKEEERFRRLDETIRLHQKNGNLVAAAREPGLFRLFHRKKK
ncbi:MAG: helix-turn-helix domain-containing protein [Blautia sp.]|nr:helix-turn-helix domain-containing protein [Blautia sp.]MDD5965952.1 helix-turn-helix domain-containing protein [Blautia sp.]MDY2897530.1 helix-turn-helix domain-containing protein [Candidatus Limivivens sp.]SCG87704.1 HTH-type transcriptional repressor YcgE [uncultured Clostridium sp.]